MTLSRDISISGNSKQIAKAKKILSPMLNRLETLNVVQARLSLQDAIDDNTLYASILFRGQVVWGRKRITNNLKRIIARGQLYGNKQVKWMRVNPNICLPSVPQDFKPILSEYFYQFLTMCCGSNPHYSRAGWIGIYPTLADLKRFFMKNEHGKQVSDYVPDWKADAQRVVEDIERMLYPFRSYLKAKEKEEARRQHRIR
ncbi:MAG: hypothetical protein ABSB28_05415 [Candidatus Bathyarchaeia archaeon]